MNMDGFQEFMSRCCDDIVKKEEEMSKMTAQVMVDKQAYEYKNVEEEVKKMLAMNIIKNMTLEDVELLFEFNVGDHPNPYESARGNLLLNCRMIYSIDDLKKLKQMKHESILRK